MHYTDIGPIITQTKQLWSENRKQLITPLNLKIKIINFKFKEIIILKESDINFSHLLPELPSK